MIILKNHQEKISRNNLLKSIQKIENLSINDNFK